MIGNTLKVMRIANGMSKTELGEASDVSSAFINDVERNRKAPTLKTLERMCSECHYKMSDFFCLSEYHDSLSGTATELKVYQMLLLKALLIRQSNMDKLAFEQQNGPKQIR